MRPRKTVPAVSSFHEKNTEAYQVIIHRPGKEGDQRNFHAHSLRAKLKGMLNGLEAEVALVVDVMLSTERLVDAIRAFDREFPTVAPSRRQHLLTPRHQSVSSSWAKTPRAARISRRR